MVKRLHEISKKARSGDEQRFVDKHINNIRKFDYPEDVENQFKGVGMNTKRLADYEKGEDMSVYESKSVPKSFKKMSDSQLKDWLKKNDSDDIGMSPAFGNQLKMARKELVNRGMSMRDIHESKTRSGEVIYAREPYYVSYELKSLSGDRWNKTGRGFETKRDAEDYIKRAKNKNNVRNVSDVLERGTHYESTDISERSLSDDEKENKEKVVKGMKKNKKDLKDRYGDDWKSVMYGAATNKAKKMDEEKDVYDIGATIKYNSLLTGRKKTGKVVKIKSKYDEPVYELDNGAIVYHSDLEEETKLSNADFKKDMDYVKSFKNYKERNKAASEMSKKWGPRGGAFLNFVKESSDLNESKKWMIVGVDNVDGERFSSEERYNSERDAEKVIKKIEKNKTKSGRTRFSNLVAVPVRQLDEAENPYPKLKAAGFEFQYTEDDGVDVYEDGRGCVIKREEESQQNAVYHVMDKEGNLNKTVNDANTAIYYSRKMKKIYGLNESRFDSGLVTLKDGSVVEISEKEAELLNSFFDDLNAKNKKEMKNVLMQDEDGFEEILGFSKEAD